MTPERYEKVSDIFGRSTELLPEKRLDFVERACGVDVELKREILSLLKHHPADEHPVAGAPPSVARKGGSRVALRWRRNGKHGFVAASVVAACALGVIGIILFLLIDRIQKVQLEDNLSTVLDADVAAVKLWIEFTIESSERWASHPRLVEIAQRLLALKQQGAGTIDLLKSEENRNFLEILTPVLDRPAIRGVHLVTLEDGLLASTPVDGAFQSVKLKPETVALITRALEGETVFSPPYMEHSKVELLHVKERVPIVGIVTPVTGRNGKPFAVLFFRWRVDEEFARLLSMARLGDSGETYAFDRTGMVVSALRNEGRLRELGVIAADAPAGTALNVSLRDPGGDLEHGHRGKAPRETLPLTRMAAQATAGISGIDITGYRDYAGRKVVGTWRWLDQYGLGIAAEIGYDEAYAASRSVRHVFGGMFVVLLATAVFGFARAHIAFRLRGELEHIQEIGPYEIEESIGQGGMGTVYRAKHRLLKRPTAIKIIRENQVGPRAIKRFTSEVRAMSRLIHPNTIQIFDFGLQADKSLYFAMEYLDGITMQELVEREKALPWARVVYLLKQVCGSLIEAHAMGLIHRDIKPQNIMICCLGGEGDFVKVLDFGLVKDVEAEEPSITSTMEGDFAGTPLYMAPERMRDPRRADARSDIYSLGAVAYHLLTGKPAFRGVNTLDTCFRAMTEKPPDISGALELPENLSLVIMRSLAADPDARPSTVREVLDILQELPVADRWNRAKAEAWWRDRGLRRAETGE